MAAFSKNDIRPNPCSKVSYLHIFPANWLTGLGTKAPWNEPFKKTELRGVSDSAE